MLAATAEFNRVNARPNASPIFALVIYGSTKVFYFSDRAFTKIDFMGESTLAFEAVVKKWGTIRASIDPFNKKSTVGNVTITLINAPFHKDTTRFWDVNDYLHSTNIVNCRAEIYLGYDELASLSDFTRIFVGVVQPIEDVTPSELNIVLEDGTFLYHQNIPPTEINYKTFPAAPASHSGERLSIAYGLFGLDNSLAGSLHPCRWIGKNKICVSDSIINSIDALWLVDETLGMPARFLASQYSANTNDAGRATITITNMNDMELFGEATGGTTVQLDDVGMNWKANQWKGYTVDYYVGATLYTNVLSGNTAKHLMFSSTMTAPIAGSTYHIYKANCLNEAEAFIWPITLEYVNESDFGGLYPFYAWDNKTFDRDLVTLGNMRTPANASGTNSVIGYAKWYLPDLQEAGIITAVRLDCAFDLKYAFNVTQTIALYNPSDILALSIDLLFGTEPVSGNYAMTADATGMSGNWSRFKDHYIKLPINFNVGPGATPERDNLDFFDVRLRVKYRPNFNNGMQVYAECKGMTYGSWIDAGGRSNSYNAGQVISNPAFIIESILRDVLGYGDSDINTASFDEAGTALASWTLAVSIVDYENSKDVIEKICQQCKLNFFIDSQGLMTVRAIDTNPSSADDTLSKDDIDINGLRISEGNIQYLTNKLNLSYNYWPIFQDYRGKLTNTNSASITQYGATYEKDMIADSIPNSTVAQLLSDHFIGSSGFWKDLRPILPVNMSNLRKVIWEVGDLIQPDITMNDAIRLFNVDWGSAIFMVIDKSLSSDSLDYVLIKVN